MLIYKILLPSEWADFEADQRFDGSLFDHESGFIHFSSRRQVAETARRVFADEPELVVVAVDDQALGDALRWEAADRGKFPHLYASLAIGAVAAVHRVAGADAVEGALPREPDSPCTRSRTRLAPNRPRHG